jgi:hypothetical protein
VATADYYRKQAATCRQMSRACADPILADRLDVLAAEFLEAATDTDDARPLQGMADHSAPNGSKKCA